MRLMRQDEIIEEAIEEIDAWLVKYALARREKKYHYLSAKRNHVFHLRVILAEIKRLRAKEKEHD